MQSQQAGWIGRSIPNGVRSPRDAVAASREAIVSHDGYRRDEEKGATPDPLMGIWPFGYPVAEDEEAATLALYLGQADPYVGSPMLSALYGVWAVRRAIAASLEAHGRRVCPVHHRTLQTNP